MKRKLFILTTPIFVLLVAFGWLALVQAAMLHVNSLADNTTADGFCTLREAIINANDNAATHPDCPAGNGADTIYLTNLSGQITLLADLPPITDLAGTAVQGPGAATLAISGNNSRRIFDVQNGAPFTLRDLTLRNASSSSPGSALRAAGGSAIDIWHSAFTANANSAINIEGGSLQVVDATFTDNATTGAGGGIRTVYNSSAAQPAPTVLVDDSTFSGNQAGGGHAIHQASGSLTLNNSAFSENGAPGQGYGTVEYRDDIAVTITGCDFLDNQGYQGAALHDPWGNGAVWVKNSQFIGNTGQAAGAIRHGGGRALTISHSTFGENTADPAQNGQGGAINSYAAITITASAFYSNTAHMGGVIYTHNDATGPVTIDDSLFMGNNAANSGGAIWYGRGLYVTNSAFYGNTAVNGGALASFEGWGDVVNSTFAHNGANNGAALYHLNTWYAAPTLQNSLIANPQWGNNCSAGAGNLFPDNGGNLQWPNNSCNPAIQVADPLLDLAGPQDNGGPTWSIALQAGSPAIDLIAVGGGFFCPPTDQRGAPRPVDGDGNSVADCDSGAYEAGGLAPVPTPTVAPTPLPLPTAVPEPVPTLQLAKLAENANSGSLLPGDTISYTIVVTNSSGAAVTGVTISDTIPAHTTYVDDSDTPEADADADPLVWSDRTIPPGVTTFRFAVLVDGNAGGATITNVVCLAQPGFSPQCTGPVEPPGGGLVGWKLLLPIIVK